MTKPTVKTYDDPDAFARNVAEWLTTQAEATKDKFSIALSGGSTPKHLFEVLATPPFARRFPWSRTHLFWGDDRFVPYDDERSNYRMTRIALLDHVPLPAENIHPVPFSDDIDAAAKQYEQTLKTYFGAGTPGPDFPLFDVALMGLGEDGHTASLFPGSVALQEQNAWVLPVTDGGVPPHRITLTYPVFAATRKIAFLVEGQRKASILKGVLGGDHRYPSARVTALEELIWFTDKAAIE